MPGIKAAFAFTGAGFVISGFIGSHLAEIYYPPDKIASLPPEPGNQIFGYMGCPESKIEAIKKRERLLFFTDGLEVPQRYALARTSLWDRLCGKDRPVVLQLEIAQNDEINPSEYWRDSALTHPISIVPHHVSFYPALSPQTQRRHNLQVRVHHVVTCRVLQQGGALCRAFNAWRKK